MPPQYDAALVTNAPMAPTACTTNILSTDPILSVVCSTISDKNPINVKDDILIGSPKIASNSAIDLEPAVLPDDVIDDTIDVEMSSMPPSVGSTDTGSVKSEKKADDVDMKSIGESSEVEKEREEVMQIGDAESVTTASKANEIKVRVIFQLYIMSQLLHFDLSLYHH